MSPGRIAWARPAAPSTAGTPSARSMTAVWPSAPPSSVATPASRDGIEQRRVRRPQRFADQHRAFGQAGEAAVRRPGQVAHQPPADLAHLLGASRQAGAVLRRHAGLGLRQDRRGDRLGLRHHRALGRQQRLLDPPPHARGSGATSPACGYRLRSAAPVRPGFPPAARPAGAQLGELLARLGDGGIQAGALGGAVGGLDLVPGDLRRRLRGAEHRPDRDAGGDRDAGEARFRPRRGRAARGSGACAAAAAASPVHRSRTRPARRARRAPPWRPTPRRAAR